MGGGGVGPGREQGNDGGVVAPGVRQPLDPDPQDLGRDVVLAYPGLRNLGDPLVHAGDDASCRAQVVELALGLDRPFPVDEQGGVDELRIREAAPEHRVGGGRVVVVVHLDPDSHPAVPAVGDDGGEVLHRVPLGGHDEVVGVRDNVVAGHVHRPERTGLVLAAAPPDRLPGGRNEHALGDVERPAIVAGEPRHVRRIGRDEELDAGRVHRGPRLREPHRVLVAGEREVGSRHRAKPKGASPTN